MDISRAEQRVVHTLAQGGRVVATKNAKGKIAEVECLNRDGWRLDGFGLALFQKLKRRNAIASRGGGPYRITRRGLDLVRSQVDNR